MINESSDSDQQGAKADAEEAVPTATVVGEASAAQTSAPSSGGREAISNGPRYFLKSSSAHARLVEQASSSINDFAICGGRHLQDKWLVPEKLNFGVVCGGQHLDFSNADFVHSVVVVNCFAVCGGAEIRVPRGVRVRMNGCFVCGGSEPAATANNSVEQPLIVVNHFGVCGGASVEVSELPVLVVDQ